MPPIYPAEGIFTVNGLRQVERSVSIECHCEHGSETVSGAEICLILNLKKMDFKERQ
jgi:hypothetical protein